jgi:small subunit ribosomal protein S6
MRKYETLFIINPTLEQEVIDGLVEKFKDVITSNKGEIETVDIWGKRRLAYPVNDLNEGVYVLINYNGDPDAAGELERMFRITDGIEKYLIVKDEK